MVKQSLVVLTIQVSRGLQYHYDSEINRHHHDTKNQSSINNIFLISVDYTIKN